MMMILIIRAQKTSSIIYNTFRKEKIKCMETVNYNERGKVGDLVTQFCKA